MGLVAAYILMVVSIIVSVSKNILGKKEKGCFEGLSNLFKVNLVVGVLGVLSLLVIGTDFTHFTDPRFALIALAYGASIMLSQIFYLLAIKYGSLSVCSLLYCCGFLIPTIATPILYPEDEALSAGNIIGIVVLVFALVLVTGKLKKFDNLKWIPFVVLALIFSGALGLIQKIYAHNFSGGQSDVVCFAFVFVVVFALAAMLITHKKTPVRWIVGETKKERAVSVGAPVVYAACVIFNNVINMILADPIPGAIFFAGFNGSVIALTALGSSLVLKEKLSKLQYVGIVLSIAAIIVISVT